MPGEIAEQIKKAVARLKKMGYKGVLAFLKEQPAYWWRVFRRSFRMFMDNRGPYQANALAYRSMLSMLPMLVFVISLSTWLFGDNLTNLTNDLKDIVQEHVVPDSEIVDNTFIYVEQFKEQAQKGTQFGFLIMLITSILLINGIEVIFNNIWNVKRRRPYAWRVLSYTAMTIFIPVMLGLSIYMTAQLQVETIEEALQQNVVIKHIPLFHWTWGLIRNMGVPLAIMWALFLAMYKWLPNTRVETGAALIGALVAAVAFELCKWGFSLFAAEMVASRQIWWGTIGIFLVFLVWVYLIWWILLFGAQLAYVIQNYRYVLRINPDLEKRVGESYLACRVMLEIAERHMSGLKVPSIRELAGRLEVEVPRIQDVLGKLTDANIVILGTSANDRKEEDVYVPGRDLGTITVAEVIRTVNDAWRIPSFTTKQPQASSEPSPDHDSSTTPENALDLLLNQSRLAIEADLGISFRSLIEKNPQR
jgi:membrane protein